MKDKNDFLILACQENKFEEVKKLILESNVNINSSDKDDKTALQIACEQNNLKIAEFLIKHGAKVDVNDRYMDSPLSEAAKNNNKKLVKLILEQGITYPLCNDNEHDDYFNTSIIDKDYLGINEDIKELLIKAEEEAEKKRDIAYLEREKRRSELFAKSHRDEILEKLIKESTTENKKYKYNEIALKKFIKNLGKEFIESALAYEEEFVETGFTVEYKYDSDKKLYSVDTKYR